MTSLNINKDCDSTHIENIVESDIVTAFQKQDYSKWNVEVYLVKSKKENHPRVISTLTHTIFLDRGISTFGKNGKNIFIFIND